LALRPTKIHTYDNHVLSELAALSRDILALMVRTSKLAYVLLLLATVGCNHRTVDSVRARKLSAEFMSDLIAHRTDAAFDKMELEFTTMVNRSDFAPQLNKLLGEYCGWPRVSELKDVQGGFKLYADGHQNPIRKFIYATTTGQSPKDKCYFSVDIAPSGQDVKVTTFGPLRVLPEIHIRDEGSFPRRRPCPESSAN
jgi:hypothetical protein